MSQFRTGFGYDVHQLVAGRQLLIGGIQIPNSKGALGHSDADVLLHALADALLGAAALGDIGQYFPDSDPSNKDISSRKILSYVYRLITEKGYQKIGKMINELNIPTFITLEGGYNVEMIGRLCRSFLDGF